MLSSTSRQRRSRSKSSSNSTCAGETAHGGTGFAWLDGYGTSHTDSATQSVTIPAGKTSATLAFYLHIDTHESGSIAYDTLKVQVLNSSGSVLATLATYTNVNAAAGYSLATRTALGADWRIAPAFALGLSVRTLTPLDSPNGVTPLSGTEIAARFVWVPGAKR